MKLHYVALAAVMAGGVAIGASPLFRSSEEAAAPAEPAGPAMVAESDTVLAEAEAERDRLRARLDAVAAERDELAGQLAAAGSGPDAAEPAQVFADLAESAAEIDRLKAEIGVQSVEIARLTVALDASRAELADLREALMPLPQRAEARLLPVSLEGAPDDPVFDDFAARLDAAKGGPAPRPDPAVTVTAAADAAPPRPAAARPTPLTAILFEHGSARLTVGGLVRAADVARALQALGATQVRVAGHADTTGSPAANLRLSRARAEAVAAALEDAGVPPDAIGIVALGEDAGTLPIPTAPGVAEPLNRSATVYAAG